MADGLIFLRRDLSKTIVSVARISASTIKGMMYLSKETNRNLLVGLDLHGGTCSRGVPQSASFPMND